MLKEPVHLVTRGGDRADAFSCEGGRLTLAVSSKAGGCDVVKTESVPCRQRQMQSLSIL
jgi:hypothetical protein